MTQEQITARVAKLLMALVREVGSQARCDEINAELRALEALLHEGVSMPMVLR